MTNGAPQEVRRINAALSRRAADALDEQQAAEGCGYTDIANRALILYGYVQSHLAKGEQLLLRHPDGTVERVTLL